MYFRMKGDKHKYDFRDNECIGRKCWAPGLYQHRGATLSGSRNSGSSDTPCCMNREYHGCPRTTVFDKDLAKARKEEGWKKG